MKPSPLQSRMPQEWYAQKAKADAEMIRLTRYSQIFWTLMAVTLFSTVIATSIWAMRETAKTFIAGGLI